MLQQRPHPNVEPSTTPLRRRVTAVLTVLLLLWLGQWLSSMGGASWATVIAHEALAVGGLSLLILLFAFRTTETSPTRRRQFTIAQILFAMLGLGMLLAGVMGILRLIGFVPARATVEQWLFLALASVLVALFAVPLLASFLDTLLSMANAAIQIPEVRRQLRRILPRGAQQRGKESAYIHGTDPREQERLRLLNALTNKPFVEFLQVAPGMQVLEVGSGLGLLVAEVAAAQRGVSVTGLERSPEQLAAAVPAGGVCYVPGDAHELPFADASFDLVYARYLLEHVADPVQVLREMRRVARPGGRVLVQENDISLVRLDPPCPTFEQVWMAFATWQRRLGGDGLIGSRLFRLFRDAGFRQVELSVQPELHWSLSPGFSGWIENLQGNIASARRGLIESELCTADQIDRAIEELAALARRDDASLTFVWNRAAAVA